MDVINKSKNVCISLSEEEAIVFFDWLVRFNESDKNEFHHKSEEKVLWDLEAVLEKSNPIILVDDYKTKLLAAREKIKDLTGDV